MQTPRGAEWARRSDEAERWSIGMIHKCVVCFVSNLRKRAAGSRQGIEIIVPLLIRGSENQKLLLSGLSGQKLPERRYEFAQIALTIGQIFPLFS